jgi:hypothetical protein
MTMIVGTFEDDRSTLAAHALFADAGYRALLIMPSYDEQSQPTFFNQRGETVLRAALRWCIRGALIVEAPSIVVVIFLPVDLSVKLFLGATMWKFGAAFGGWFGAIAAGERGLDAEVAAEYELHLAEGRCLLSVDVRRSDRPFARGAMLESGAVEVRDVVGTFEVKRPQVAEPAPAG